MEENDLAEGIAMSRRNMLENLTFLEFTYETLGRDKVINWILKEDKKDEIMNKVKIEFDK